MLNSWFKNTTMRALILSVFLAGIYVCQAIPHMHAGIQPSGHSADPATHTHHSHGDGDHSHGDVTDPEGNPHHHELTRHHDLHSFRIPTKELGANPAVLSLTFLYLPPASLMSVTTRVEASDLPPARPPLSLVERRGPPLFA